MSPRVPAAALVSLLVALHGCGPVRPSGEGEGAALRIPVSFRLENSDAGRVCVAGSFNAWSPSTDCMHREGDGWSVRVFLQPGRHIYVFVVDDRLWIPDAQAPFWEDSGFGQRNSVLIVE
jgi:hypothetical protein